MPGHSYEVLLHNTFVSLSLRIKEKHPEIEGPLVTALEEIKADPNSGTMQGVVRKNLKGIIHKKHVGGRDGFRLIYLVPIGKNLIIPVYISPNERSNFSYDDVDWEGFCVPIYDDYVKKNYSAFKNLK